LKPAHASLGREQNPSSTLVLPGLATANAMYLPPRNRNPMEGQPLALAQQFSEDLCLIRIDA
jgi:hypothetical protein